MNPFRQPRRGGRLLGWWYVSIGLGFVLLGFRNLIAGASGWSITLRWIVAAGFLLLGAGVLRPAQAGSGAGDLVADPKEIIQRSVSRDLLNFERLKNYTYTERNEERTYDRAGHLKKTETETYEILILGGRDYGKLVARGDKPLSERDARKEEQKLDREVARRQNESAQEKAKLEKQRQQQRKFLNEVPEAFNFQLIGEEQVSGKPAWVITAEPKPDYRAHERLAKVVAKMRGKIWIDEGEYQWVKVQAEVAEPLSFGLGLLKILPGATLQFEQTRVNDEVWLPASASIKVNARAAFFREHGELDMRFQDYRKFQAKSEFFVDTDSK
jgi:hypothetical protein